jgi:hypothetical protein
MINTKKCLICKGGRKNDCLHWHVDPDTNDVWVYCVGKCQRAYSIRSYCYHAGIALSDFLKGDFDFKEANKDEVNVMSWPARFIPLSDPRSGAAVEYIKSRGLTTQGDMYYDIERNGIVFPYYYDNHFCGAQTRFIEPKIHEDGEVQKMDTLPGTRLGNLIYGWNQTKFIGNVKGVIITEGSFNAIAINQALNEMYKGINNNPWRAVACSGAGATKHHREIFKDLKDKGLKIVVAPDTDEAGMNMLKKFKEADACTHYALTGSTEDWNDKLKILGHKEFAKFFMSCVKTL